MTQDNFLVITFFLLITTITITSRDQYNCRFGDEYGNIAAAIVSGQGYSNPFLLPSGPTTWKLPLIVLMYAAVFVVFGIKSTASMWALIILRNIALTVALFLILKISKQAGTRKFNFLIPIIFTSQMLMVHYFKRDTDDVSFICLLSCLTIYIMIDFWQAQGSRKYHSLYWMAIILPLSSATLTMVYGLFLTGTFLVYFIRNASQTKQRYSVLAICLLAVTVFGWSLRNKSTFGYFIPFTSNAGFEMYLGNFHDQDGLISGSNLWLDHPVANIRIAKEYQKLGEIDFIAIRKERMIQRLSGGLKDYWYKVMNRGVNVLFWTDRTGDVLPLNTSLVSNSELEHLYQQRLAAFGRWTSFAMPEARFRYQIKALGLTNENLIISDWIEKKQWYQTKKGDLRNVVIGYTVSLVPFLFILLGLLVKSIRRSPVFILTSFTYVLHFIPYILISHYLRYQLFVLALQTILMFMVLSYALEFVALRLQRLGLLPEKYQQLLKLPYYKSNKN